MSELLEATLIMLFSAVGLGLVGTSTVLNIKMRKEVKKGKIVLWNNFLPYWNSSDFTQKGNELRIIYNKIYFAAIIYITSLLVIKNYYG